MDCDPRRVGGDTLLFRQQMDGLPARQPASPTSGSFGLHGMETLADRHQWSDPQKEEEKTYTSHSQDRASQCTQNVLRDGLVEITDTRFVLFTCIMLLPVHYFLIKFGNGSDTHV